MKTQEKILVPRKKYLQQLITWREKDLIKVTTGVRRCGKSTLFALYIAYLKEQGVSDRQIISINLEDIKNEDLLDYHALYKHITDLLQSDVYTYVFIDEIQQCKSFEKAVDSLFIKDKVDVYITGSNSKMLSSDIHTALRGRSIEIRVHTLSFSEYFSFVGGDKDKAFRDYQLYEGFPYAATEQDSDLKIQYLKMLQDTVATRNVIERYSIRNVSAFYATYDFLCSNIGSTVSAKKISDTLKSNGYKTITADTIGNYLT